MMNVMPGSGHLCSGQTITLKLRKTNILDGLFVLDADGQPASGLKMANGTNSQGRSGFPGTRGKSAALMRERLIQAQQYLKDRESATPLEPKPRDLALETLGEVLQGKRLVHHHTHRHDDVLTVLRIAQEFGFRVVLHHVSDAWMIADEIAAAGAACSIIMLDSPGGKLEAKDLDWKSAPALEKAGVLMAFHTDDPITDSRLFIRSAALGVRAGMSRAKALEGVTLAAAKILEQDQRVGSLTLGKDADIAIFSGDPLSIYSRVLETWVEGQVVFRYGDASDRLYAEGGYGASTPQAFYMCCYDTWEAR
jgi:imidazolonepropionase-like amidohydrolase